MRSWPLLLLSLGGLHLLTAGLSAGVDGTTAELPDGSTAAFTTVVPLTTSSPTKDATQPASPLPDTTLSTIKASPAVPLVKNDSNEVTHPENGTVATVLATSTTTTAAPTTPLFKLSNVSAPCSERLGGLMRRVLRGFPGRLPELWEFRRRRFLRAAVVGGLPQLRVERLQVNCNLTTARTEWRAQMRAQVDGICNLGITGLPRMYLRFTGPVVAKARFVAPLSEDSRPELDELVIVSADVQEIHYQSVLGFEQPFVERASKYLLQRALREEVLGPLREAINAEIENPGSQPTTEIDLL